MKIGLAQIKELAALHAAGALDGAELRLFTQLLAENAEARRELASFGGTVESLVESLPSGPRPAPELKQKILRAAERSKERADLEARLSALAPSAAGGFGFLRQAATANWLPLPVPGAFVKLLSFDPENGYATVLGKLEPGARYPAHKHIHPEDIYMLEGDLHIGEETISAGDFHHAAAATSHGVNWSENGCILLAVLSKEDLLHQFQAL
jgi:quercetin dioxygenase-like cupin family protein